MHRAPSRARARDACGGRPIKRVAVALVVLALAGCGSEPGGEGEATLWITRDRGSELLKTATVPAGLTLMQALDREADISTRYGGRYIQSIDGLEGSLGERRDWFWFVNGYEGDESAADYELRDGDVGWWDYRSWRGRMREPVVVGAFPEPFVHGWAGKTRPAVVRYAVGARGLATKVAGLIGAGSVAPDSVAAPEDANVVVVRPGKRRFTARLRDAEGRPGSPVEFALGGELTGYQRHYEVGP